jgi:hypothetical protein
MSAALDLAQRSQPAAASRRPGQSGNPTARSSARATGPPLLVTRQVTGAGGVFVETCG